MTTVTIRRDSSGIAGIRVSGHSGYAPAGGDIVCAAASVLITTCVNALESVAGIVPQVFQQERSATIDVTLPKDLPLDKQHDAQLILRTVAQGFMDVAEQYPKYLQIL